MSKKILDACCGARMFWFDRQHPDAVYMDNREVDTSLCDGRKLLISPDVVADFTAIPFDDESFYLVVFDPPHLIHAGENSWLSTKYGKLNKNWRDELKKGFAECFRVLKNNGTLVFKWNEDQIKIKEILNLTSVKPLFGNRRDKTHFVVFMKTQPVFNF